jgi:hypothetical protein
MNLLKLQDFAELLIKGPGLPFRQYPDQFDSSSGEEIQMFQLKTAEACRDLELYKRQTGEFIELFLETFVEHRQPLDVQEENIIDALVRSSVQAGYVIALCENDFKWDMPKEAVGKRTETMLEAVCSGLEREVTRKFPTNPPVKIRTMATYAGYLLGRQGSAVAFADLGAWKTDTETTHTLYKWTIG